MPSDVNETTAHEPDFMAHATESDRRDSVGAAIDQHAEERWDAGDLSADDDEDDEEMLEGHREFVLTIDASGEVFDAFGATETARLLHHIAERYYNGDFEGEAEDIAGNTVAWWSTT